MASERAQRPLYLSLTPGDAAGGPILLLDAHDPSRLREIGGLDDLGALPPAAVVVIDGSDLRTAEGRLLAGRGFMWSLLDPSHAGRGLHLQLADPLAAERALREEGARLWRGIGRWAAHRAELRREVGNLCEPLGREAAALFDLVEALAADAGADPFAGWEEAAAPAAGGTVRPLPLPDDPQELAGWLAAPDGLGALYGDGFTPRPEQGVMARDVAEALRTGRPLLVEAGTGVGKTLAYLAPLLAHLRLTGGRGVVSTHTRALQGQLLGQDLPRLAAVAPDIAPRLLMGRSNYLCRTRELRFLAKEPVHPSDLWARLSFLLWLEVTGSGMREEIQDHPALRRHVPEIFDSPEPCSPSVCYGERECHVQRARRLAREARLVVVNHALLMNDFAAGHTLVGEYEALVVDEAHRLPQAALDTFEICCDASRAVVVEELLGEPGRAGALPVVPRLVIAELANRSEAGQAAVPPATGFVHALAETLAAYRAWLAALERSFAARREGRTLHGKVRVYDRDETFGGLRAETTMLLDAAATCDRAYAAFANALERVTGVDEILADELATLARAAELASRLEQDVGFLVADEDPDWVVWLDPGREEGLRAAGATRLEAGPLLGELWRTSSLAPVLTSATLSVGEDFSHMERELGASRLQPRTVTSLVPSPFDYAEQALFLTTPAFPAPDTAGWQDAVADLAARLLRAAPRKTLILFTSYVALQNVAQRLRELLAGWPGPGTAPVLLVQGSGAGAADLMSRFRRERRAVLLGTNTFWEGIDLPGEELEMLVVTKLPFLVPADPWVEARCERLEARGENPFLDFMVRDAVLRLRQGIGRLVRAATDRGVVVLLDSRLHTKPYGMTFLKSLPAPAAYCAGPDEIVARAGAFFA